MVARTTGDAWGRATAQVCDALLAVCVLGLAAWTVAYHACLALGLPAGWALGALAAALVTSGPFAARLGAPSGAPAPDVGGREGASRRAAAVAGCLAIAAAAAIGFARWPWPPTWALWAVAAVAAVLAAARGPLLPAACSRPGAATAVAWATALAALSLFLVRTDPDDAYYLRQASWIAAHGRFPLGDTLHSHDVLPAVFSPPLPSYEALVGSTAAVAGLPPAGLAYLGVAPAVNALAVLALWRLLRAWEIRQAGPALTVAVVFLLVSVSPASHDPALMAHLPGDFFVARAWQGKVILAAVLVPLLIALLHDHATRPRRHGLVLLAACGAAAVGLSATASFLVPVIAVAYLSPLAARAPAQAAAGVTAACAYPLAALAAALVADGRQPAGWKPYEVAPELLMRPALGSGLVGFAAVLAALAGPLLLTPRCARRGTAAAALAAAVAFAPGVAPLVYELTGLGRPLWRLVWAMPIAALVGAAVTQPAGRHPSAAQRRLPALAACAVLALAGTPVWQGAGTGLAGRPAWKREPSQLAAARVIARLARPGAVVLAPAGLSQTLLMLDGRLTAVAPRAFYTRALAGGAVAPRARAHAAVEAREPPARAGHAGRTRDRGIADREGGHRLRARPRRSRPAAAVASGPPAARARARHLVRRSGSERDPGPGAGLGVRELRPRGARAGEAALGAREREDGLRASRSGDDQVGPAVPVGVEQGERAPEAIPATARSRDARGALGVAAAARRGRPAAAPAHDHDLAAPAVLARHADHEIAEAVVIEVPCRERGAEAVADADVARHPGVRACDLAR